MKSTNLFTPMVRCALVGLTLSPCALLAKGKSYTFCNQNKDAKATWYAVIDRESLGTVRVYSLDHRFLGDACTYKGHVPGHVPAAKVIVALAPRSQVRLEFGPEDKGSEYRVKFHLFDQDWENGAVTFVQAGKSMEGARKLSREKDDSPDSLAGNPSAVEILEGGTDLVSLWAPTWNTWNTVKGSVRDSMARRDGADGCSLDELTLLMDQALEPPDLGLLEVPTDATDFLWEPDPTPRAKRSQAKEVAPVAVTQQVAETKA